MVVFAVKIARSAEHNLFDRTRDYYFDWGFYLAIGAAGLSVVTFILMCVTFCYDDEKN